MWLCIAEGVCRHKINVLGGGMVPLRFPGAMVGSGGGSRTGMVDLRGQCQIHKIPKVAS
jgi:hypothetical protein